MMKAAGRIYVFILVLMVVALALGMLAPDATSRSTQHQQTPVTAHTNAR